MLDQSVLDRFVESCPAAVMIRATLENLLPPERLDQIFEDHRARQYQQDVFFSDLVALMSAVATRTHASVHKSYLASQRKLNVSPEAVYAKLRRLEPDVTAGLIRETAVDAAGAIDAMPGARKMVLEGFEVFFLDGNHLAGSEHRIAELRHTREGALPGQTLALLDAQRELVTELVPGEDGHAQERSLLPELLRRIRAQTVLVADRNFCTTKFLFGLRRAGAFFIIRQHASTLNWETLGKRERIGRVATGVAYEREVALREGTKADAEVMRARRITIELDETTEDGETAIHVLTNLTPEQADARRIAEAYRRGVSRAVDDRGGVPEVDRRVAVRGANAGLSQGGVVFVRDGGAGLERVRGGQGGAPRGAWPGADRGDVLGRPLHHACGLDQGGHGHRGRTARVGSLPPAFAGGAGTRVDEPGPEGEPVPLSQEEAGSQEAETETEKWPKKPSSIHRQTTRGN